MTSLNGVRKRRPAAKETSIANCEVLDEKYRIAARGGGGGGPHMKGVGMLVGNFELNP